MKTPSGYPPHYMTVVEGVIAGKTYVKIGDELGISNKKASEIFNSPKVQLYYEQRLKEIAKKTELTGKYVLEKIHETYLFNAEIEEYIKKNGTVYKLMRNAKVALKSLELLGKNQKLFTEVVETRNYEEIEKRLRNGIDRIKKQEQEDD